MGIASANKQLPLLFWTEVHLAFPILWRIARRILPTPASSTDVERLFSVCGLICSDLHGSLSPEHVNMLASLNTWIKDDWGYRSARSVSSILSATRFVSMNADLEFVQPEDNPLQDSDDENQ
jgi:hypothetical protein